MSGILDRLLTDDFVYPEGYPKLHEGGLTVGRVSILVGERAPETLDLSMFQDDRRKPQREPRRNPGVYPK